jgi:tetratricopeptide (TPR) repeat protein
LIGLGRYNDALVVFRNRLSDATRYRLSANRLRVELLESLFPDGLSQPPRPGAPALQAFTFGALGQAYKSSGRPGAAISFYRQSINLRDSIGNDKNVAVRLGNLADALGLTGRLRESEAAARRTLALCRELGNHFQEGVVLNWHGLALAARGMASDSRRALERALRIDVDRRDTEAEGVDSAYLAQRALWLGDVSGASYCANRAWEVARLHRIERDFILAARLQGEAALAMSDLALADERLHHALVRARTVDLSEEELPALTALAELHRRRGNSNTARELLDQVWESADRGPYPLLHANALNVLAQIERDAGNTTAAIQAADEAYQKAWCDGPPFAYYWGLQKARAHLDALAAPGPALPPYDESKYEAMPMVEIDPS